MQKIFKRASIVSERLTQRSKADWILRLSVNIQPEDIGAGIAAGDIQCMAGCFHFGGINISIENSIFSMQRTGNDFAAPLY